MNIWKWRDAREAWADLFVEPSFADDPGYVADLVAVAASEAFSMGATTLQVVLPETLAPDVQARFDATPAPLQGGDPWFVKDLRGAR